MCGRRSSSRSVLIAAYAYVVGGDHEARDRSKSVTAQIRQSKGVTIGDGAWLGAGVTVFDGVTVGAHAIAGAGAVVRADIPAGSTAVGVPARVLDPDAQR